MLCKLRSAARKCLLLIVVRPGREGVSGGRDFPRRSAHPLVIHQTDESGPFWDLLSTIPRFFDIPEWNIVLLIICHPWARSALDGSTRLLAEALAHSTPGSRNSQSQVKPSQTARMLSTPGKSLPCLLVRHLQAHRPTGKHSISRRDVSSRSARGERFLLALS